MAAPWPEIATQPNGQGIEWSNVGNTPEVSMRLGDTLYFTTTIRNVGKVPLRTAGPFDPNDCYAMSSNRYSKGFPQESGVWRVGVNFESNTGEDHPWRWGGAHWPTWMCANTTTTRCITSRPTSRRRRRLHRVRQGSHAQPVPYVGCAHPGRCRDRADQQQRLAHSGAIGEAISG